MEKRLASGACPRIPAEDVSLDWTSDQAHQLLEQTLKSSFQGTLEDDLDDQATERRDSISDSFTHLAAYGSLHPKPISTSSTRHSSVDCGVCDISTLSERSNSIYTLETIPSLSTCDPNPDTASSFPTETNVKPPRPSLLARMTSSKPNASPTNSTGPSLATEPHSFRLPPPSPETRFVDCIGMVIPGVCDRRQCFSNYSHFVSNWRLCEPLEYTTSLADHGITYTDYCRLTQALKDLLNKSLVQSRSKPKGSLNGKTSRTPSLWRVESESEPQEEESLKVPDVERIWEGEPLDKWHRDLDQLKNLNALLDGITESWRVRGIPVMLGVTSVPIFASNKLPDTIIQILHTPFQTGGPPNCFPRRLSSDGTPVDTFTHNFHYLQAQFERRRSLTQSPSISTATTSPYPQKVNSRDRTRPWPLSPNTVPVRKRLLVECYPERYGSDPFFRFCAQENVKGKTEARSYHELAILESRDRSANKHCAYKQLRPCPIALWKLLRNGYEETKSQRRDIVNRNHYNRNRNLECRANVENGSRTRLARFGFRRPIWPTHTPEMEELGLTKEMYIDTISHIEEIRQDHKSRHHHCGLHILPFHECRRGTSEDAIADVMAFIKEVNLEQRRRGASVVWTMEEIPGVHRRVVRENGSEWEISVWDQRDPLELLKQLETAGLVRKRLFFEDGH